MDDGFVFVADAVAQHQIRFDPPFILSKDTEVRVVLRRRGEKVLPEATGAVRQKVTGTVEIPRAAGLAEIYERGGNPLRVAAHLERMVAVKISKNLLKLKTFFAAISSAAGRRAGHERAAGQLERVVNSN